MEEHISNLIRVENRRWTIDKAMPSLAFCHMCVSTSDVNLLISLTILEPFISVCHVSNMLTYRPYCSRVLSPTFPHRGPTSW